MAPKEAVRQVYEKAGGVLNASSLRELPRDRRQAYNVKIHTSGIASNHHKDLIYDLLEQRFGTLNSLLGMSRLMKLYPVYFLLTSS